MNRLEKIAILAVRKKAAKILGYKTTQVVKVEETYSGAVVYLKNGNRLIIPVDDWA